MQFFFDFLPLIVFFAAYKLADIYVATAAIIAVMAVQIAFQWIKHRKINRMLLISGLLVLVFGGITLVLRDRIFIQWKPTIVNWLFAAAFLASQFIGEKPIIQRLMGEHIELSRDVWRQLNLIWATYFLVLGAANIFVVYNFDEATWVNFKLFGTLAFTLLMVFGQAIWISAKLPKSEQQE
jgi:intracellular septation protein